MSSETHSGDAVLVEKLENVVGSFLNDPPIDQVALDQRYAEARALIQQILQDEPADDTLQRYDNEFTFVRKHYPHLRSGFLEKVISNAYAQEYRFFVGGLEIFVKCYKEPLKASRPIE